MKHLTTHESLIQHRYAVEVKLLHRFYKLYEKGRKENNTPQNYIDFFEAQRFVLTEVEKALKSIGTETIEDERKAKELLESRGYKVSKE